MVSRIVVNTAHIHIHVQRITTYRQRVSTSICMCNVYIRNTHQFLQKQYIMNRHLFSLSFTVSLAFQPHLSVVIALAFVYSIRNIVKMIAFPFHCCRIENQPKQLNTKRNIHMSVRGRSLASAFVY